VYRVREESSVILMGLFCNSSRAGKYFDLAVSDAITKILKMAIVQKANLTLLV
jgi:hypothetical protein